VSTSPSPNPQLSSQEPANDLSTVSTSKPSANTLPRTNPQPRRIPATAVDKIGVFLHRRGITRQEFSRFNVNEINHLFEELGAKELFARHWRAFVALGATWHLLLSERCCENTLVHEWGISPGVAVYICDVVKSIKHEGRPHLTATWDLE
jgi:hypothetical protein